MVYDHHKIREITTFSIRGAMLKRLLTLATHRIYSLPVIVLMPHSSCNCRCVMCDIWKANHDKREISVEMLAKNVHAFKTIGVREVVLSGGEALLHSNLWKFCSLLKQNRIRITLLSTGLLLKKHASQIVENIDNVIVSLDGTQEIHDRIRNVPNAFVRISEGIRALRDINEKFSITGRCVIQRGNYFDFINIVKSARQIGLNQISFLAADVSSNAFNHPDGWSADNIGTVALTEAETLQFEKIVDTSFKELAYEYRTRFIAESKSKIKRLAQYYRAVNKKADYPRPICNAPWVSAVIESDGTVLPCFFHKPYGNLNDRNFLDIINSKDARDFRSNLDMTMNDICRKCVCSIKLRPYQLL